MKPLSSLSLIIIFFTFNAYAQHQWTRTNPGGGGSMNIAKVGPTGVVIVGSDLSGAYLSDNHGVSWEVIGHSRGMDGTHIAGIGYDPNDEDILFLGSNVGISKSDFDINGAVNAIDINFYWRPNNTRTEQLD